MDVDRCRICDAPGFEVFLEIRQVPVHVGVLWPDSASALAGPRGDIRLAFCRACGFIYNRAFDDAIVDYSLEYDNALGFSPTFQRYERELAQRLVDRYDVRDADVIEIGAGCGRFLGLVCELGESRGLGFDPSHDLEHPDPLLGDRARVEKGYYTEAERGRPADLVISRHMLEHLEDPMAILRIVRANLAEQPDTTVYFEVPNAHLALSQKSIWDVIYEHASYFVPGTLEHAFRLAGFRVLDVRSCFGDQFASVEARIDPDWSPDTPASPAAVDPALPDLVASYADEFERVRALWSDRIGTFREKGERVVVWGGGAKGVSFMALVEGADWIDRVVDINPGKQGTYLAGGGQEIVSPDRLIADPPDVIIVMNPLYAEEILGDVREMGLKARVLDVAGSEWE
jgi:hypothetical protein